MMQTLQEDKGTWAVSEAKQELFRRNNKKPNNLGSFKKKLDKRRRKKCLSKIAKRKQRGLK